MQRVKITITEEKDIYVIVKQDTMADAVTKTKEAIEFVGISNIKPDEESITEQQIKINDIDYKDIE